MGVRRRFRRTGVSLLGLSTHRRVRQTSVGFLGVSRHGNGVSLLEFSDGFLRYGYKG